MTGESQNLFIKQIPDHTKTKLWPPGFDPWWPFLFTETGQKKPHSQEGGKEQGKFSVPYNK
jgi:hypothetical protein